MKRNCRIYSIISSVHTVKVEQIMVQEVIFITKKTTYKELREILRLAPNLKSFPVVTDRGIFH